jgi:Dynein heavy chain, N-terminal region 1
MVLAVNFDPALVSLLREIRYFKDMPDPAVPIPEAALKLYERVDAFRCILQRVVWGPFRV